MRTKFQVGLLVSLITLAPIVAFITQSSFRSTFITVATSTLFFFALFAVFSWLDERSKQSDSFGAGNSSRSVYFVIGFLITISAALYVGYQRLENAAKNAVTTRDNVCRELIASRNRFEGEYLNNLQAPSPEGVSAADRVINRVLLMSERIKQEQVSTDAAERADTFVRIYVPVCTIVTMSSSESCKSTLGD
jgi:hypothetical protein